MPSSKPRLVRYALENAPAIGLSCLILSFFPVTLGGAVWVGVQDLRREWTIVGPPCAEAEAGAKAVAPYSLKRSLDYVGTRFEYHTGMVYCADIPRPGLFTVKTYQVCQFSNGGVIGVTTRDGVTLFGPLSGHRATVTVDAGKAACVVGGWFGTVR